MFYNENNGVTKATKTNRRIATSVTRTLNKMNGKQALPEDGTLQKERGRYHREAHCNREIKVQDLFNMEIM